jgi:sugar lactone lactonase YvrE
MATQKCVQLIETAAHRGHRVRIDRPVQVDRWAAAGRWLVSALLGLSFLGLGAERAAAQQVVVNPRAAQTLTTLPAEVRSPEGITADADGNLFVSTNNPGGTNVLLRLAPNGRVMGQLMFPAPLLGVEFNPRDMKVYVASVGALTGGTSKIQRVPANFGANTPIEDVANVPDLPVPSPRMEANADGTMDQITFMENAAVPNGLVFRPMDGALFFSDSFQAAVFQIADPTQSVNTCANATSCVQPVVQDGRLAAIGTPPFGANGVAFNAAGNVLFIANTGDDRILRFDLASNMLSVFAENINGADGLRSGPGNTLIVTANQADQVVILDATSGRTLAELGEFLGTTPDGAPIGLSVPASVVLVDGRLFVTNLGSGRPVVMPGTMAAGAPAAPRGLFTIARIAFPSGLGTR